MIQASELRIGNWIKDHTGLNNVVKMIGVGWVKFIDDEACAFDLCSGIPLTEELLLKMGALKSELITTYNSFGIFGENGEIIEVRYYSNGDWQLRIEGTIIGYVKYIHQLQNVVFALFNEELTLS